MCMYPTGRAKSNQEKIEEAILVCVEQKTYQYVSLPGCDLFESCSIFYGESYGNDNIKVVLHRRQPLDNQPE